MENITNNATENANVETTAVETAVETKLNVETLDKMFIEYGKSMKEIATPEDREAMRNKYTRRFDDGWGTIIDVRYIADIAGVSTTAVVSYFAKDPNRIKPENLLASIKAIGNGKPKMSEAEKAIAQLKKLGLSLETITLMMNK